MTRKKERLSWKYYDNIAEHYDVKHGVAMPGGIYSIKTKYTPILRKYINKKHTVLEIGCGTGALTPIIKRLCKELKACDVSKGMLKIARLKIKNVPFFQANTEELPFKENTFDAVVGLNTFSYCGNKKKAIVQIRRVLKPGGLFINIDMNYISPIYYLGKIINPKSINIWLGTLIESNRFYLSSLFRDSNFEILEMNEFNWIPHRVKNSLLNILKPVDRVLSRMPIIKILSMRILIVGRKNG